MKCCFCGCRCADSRLPRDWKVCGRFALCGECRRTRCRIRTLTTSVAELVAASSRDFGAAWEKTFGPDTPVLIQDRDRVELSLSGHDAIIRVFFADRWWVLRLNSGGWSAGRRTDYRHLLAGEAIALEVQLYRESAHVAPLHNPFVHKRRSGSGIVCRIAAWLPGGPRPENSLSDFDILSQQDIAFMELNKLRKAIRSNRVSFPAQVPIFPGCCHRTDLQRCLVQLYFVLGWSCSGIAARYRMVPRQVRHILKTWKQRAAKSGYIQPIPPPAVISQLKIIGDFSPPLNLRVQAKPDPAIQDSRLISALKAGSKGANEQLLERFQNPVYNLASRLLGDEASTPGVTQEVFLKAFRGVGSLCHDTSLRTWLYRIVVDESLSRLRRTFKDPQPHGAGNADFEFPLRSALAGVDPAFRAPLVLRELEDLTHDEIAEILRLPAHTVRWQIERGREALRRNLARRSGSPASGLTNEAAHPVLRSVPEAGAMKPAGTPAF